jgi:hypothetical protein
VEQAPGLLARDSLVRNRQLGGLAAIDPIR